jgi:hypothetical protein
MKKVCWLELRRLQTLYVMRATLRWYSMMLLGAALFGACSAGDAQVFDNPLTIRVESRRVLVPIAGYVSISCDDRGICSWDNDVIDGPVAKSIIKQGVDSFNPFALGLFKKMRLFEDGKEQTIESIDRLHDDRIRHDSLGVHFEHVAGTKGFWSTPDENSNVYRDNRRITVLLSWDHYQIAYIPPPSPAGSCHKIQVKAAKYGSHLTYKHKYCSVYRPSDGSLLETDVGRELAQHIAPGELGSIHPLAKANYFYVAPHRARVQIDVELPFDEVKPRKSSDKTPLFNLLIAAHATDGTVVERESAEPQGVGWVTGEFADVIVPTRYDGQIEFPSGEYKLDVSIGQGPQKFGVTEVPLRIDDYDGKDLGISSIALCKRVGKADDKPVAAEFVPLVSNGYEFTPAADTRFRTGDSVMVYFEIYEPLLGVPKAEPLSVKFEMRIADAKTGAVLTKTELSAAEWIQQGRSTIPIGVKPMLDKLAPGNYRLEIQASDSAERSTAWRAAEMSIESETVFTSQ